MSLKENRYYWKISLNNREPLVDKYYIYIFDEVIICNKNLLKKVERLRELIISYCVLVEKNENYTTDILDEIYEIIITTDKIQYTEFLAFWKVLDMSYSIFKKLENKKEVLRELLIEYCERRRKLYDKFGYTNIVIQSLYDNGVSRKKSNAGIEKLIDIIKQVFSNAIRINDINTLLKYPMGYFLPDKNDKDLFKEFCLKFKLKFEFGSKHQDKLPDMVLKVNNHYFIIEAKHIKESGGAQDKQILETIEFIKYKENFENIHYLSFIDGIYFNNFIKETDNKIARQKKDIEKYLNKNKNNFFVNTVGFRKILEDLKEEINDKSYIA